MVKDPADWKRCKLGSFVRIQRGASPRPIEDYLTLAAQSVNWIKIGDAPKNGKYIISTQERITWEGARHSVHVNLGDFILSNSMSFGRPYILKTNGCIHDGWLRLYDFQNEVDSNFLYYILSSRTVKEQYAALAAGSGVQNLNKKIVKDVEVILPPLEEQKSIANALTAFDTYIEDLTALIAKKKDIRDGALEDLVSGRTRLEGFTGEWKVYNLENLCHLITKQTGFDYTATIKGSLKKHKTNNDLPFIQNKDFDGYRINLQTDYYIPISVAVNYPKILLNQKCLLISISGKLGNVGVYDKPEIAFVGGAIGIAKFKREYQVDWAMYFIKSSIGQKKLLESEKASSHKNITIEDIRKFEIPIPRKEEMVSIVSTIKSMDQEIWQLEVKRDKMKDIRDGAMDNLLTGRIRLESNV